MKPYSMNPVLPNLWIGAEPPCGPAIGTHFDVLVLAAKEIQDCKGYPGVKKVMKVPLDDDGVPPTPEEIFLAYQAGINVAILIAKRKMVLSTCHLGKNRSALVASLAMRNLGWPADKTIREVRKARGSEALGNKWFEEIVRKYEP